MGCGGGFAPSTGVEAVKGRERGTERRDARFDGERRLIRPSKLIRAGMHMDQRLFGAWRLYQRVAAGHHLAEALSDNKQHIGFAHAAAELRIDADADIASVVRMAVIEEVLIAECASDGQCVGFGEACEIGAGSSAP